MKQSTLDALESRLNAAMSTRVTEEVAKRNATERNPKKVGTLSIEVELDPVSLARTKQELADLNRTVDRLRANARNLAVERVDRDWPVTPRQQRLGIWNQARAYVEVLDPNGKIVQSGEATGITSKDLDAQSAWKSRLYTAYVSSDVRYTVTYLDGRTYVGGRGFTLILREVVK